MSRSQREHARRLNHSKIEKRRRVKINDTLDELRRLSARTEDEDDERHETAAIMRHWKICDERVAKRALEPIAPLPDSDRPFLQ